MSEILYDLAEIVRKEIIGNSKADADRTHANADVPKIYEDYGKNAESRIHDYSTGEDIDISLILQRIENINTDLSLYPLPSVGERSAREALYKIMSYHFIAQRMSKGIEDSPDDFYKTIPNKQDDRDSITSEAYIESLESIVKLCEKKEKALSESYRNTLGDPKTRRAKEKTILENTRNSQLFPTDCGDGDTIIPDAITIIGPPGQASPLGQITRKPELPLLPGSVIVVPLHYKAADETS